MTSKTPLTHPLPTGPYAVGTFTYTVRGDREEVLEAGGMRSIPCRVYYPADPASVKGMPKAEYMSPAVRQAMKKSFGTAPAFAGPEDNRSECYPDAPRIPDRRFPLILFSHGYNAFREANSFLCIDLASHGYVVIAAAHAHECLCDEPDGEAEAPKPKSRSKQSLLPMLRGALAAMKLARFKGSDAETAQRFDDFQRRYYAFMMGRLPEWVKDMEAALRYAKQHLTDLIDFDAGVGASGHSMGGNTAYALCASNPDIRCGVNIDGALFGEYRGTVQTKPFLQISCEANARIAARAFLRHTQPVYQAVFKGMRHIGFSDAKHLNRPQSAMGKLPPDVMHENLCRCHLLFFDAFLKGSGASPVPESNDAVTVTVYPPDLQG